MTAYNAVDSGDVFQDQDDLDELEALLEAAKGEVAEAEDADFEESEHPRDEEGKFSESGSSGRKSSPGSALTTAPDREQWPEHIKSLKVPPAWIDVKINPDPNADLLVIGKDAKNRAQYVYSARFQATQSALKFSRIKELDQEFDRIQGQVNEGVTSKDPWVRENASCARLVMAMGIRPGSDTDTQAKVKAYGATTLQGSHVVQEKGQVYLRFTGKKGVALNLPVEDKDIAKDLLKRAKSAGSSGKLFNVSDTSLLDYVHTLDGGGFKTKDFRTRLASTTANEIVSKLPAPKNEKEYKKQVHNVAKIVSTRLGNTPTVALQSYIAPEVFAPWRSSYAAA